MTRTYGECVQPFKININIEELNNKIMDMIQDAVEKSLHNTHGINSADIRDIEIDGDTLVLSGEYETEYSDEYTPATQLDPPEHNVIRSCEQLDVSNLKQDLTRYMQLNNIMVINYIDVADIEENVSKCKFN